MLPVLQGTTICHFQQVSPDVCVFVYICLLVCVYLSAFATGFSTGVFFMTMLQGIELVQSNAEIIFCSSEFIFFISTPESSCPKRKKEKRAAEGESGPVQQRIKCTGHCIILNLPLIYHIISLSMGIIIVNKAWVMNSLFD